MARTLYPSIAFRNIRKQIKLFSKAAVGRFFILLENEFLEPTRFFLEVAYN